MAGNFRCWQCDRRLNVDDVEGKATVFCPKCRSPNVLRGPDIDKRADVLSKSRVGKSI